MSATFTVTAGSVTVEDGRPGVNPDPNGSFAPARKVSVTQYYDLEAGADARRSLESVAAIAHAEVRRLLHQNVEEVHERAEAALAAASAPVPDTVRSQQVAEHDKAFTQGLDAIPGADAGVNDPADVDAKIAAIVEKQKPRKAANRKANGSGAGTPAGQSAPPVGSAEGEGESGITSPSLDAIPGETAADLFSVGEDETPEITDADLNDAVATRNGIIKNPDAIRELIGTFRTGVGRFHVSMIPQAQRQSFLDQLGALK